MLYFLNTVLKDNIPDVIKKPITCFLDTLEIKKI